MNDFIVNSRYEVEREVGRGAQGVTYLARDQARQGTRVVLKIYDRGRLSDASAWEFGQLSRLEHEGIVRVLELAVVREVDGDGPSPGGSFVVQEWIDGVASDEWADAERGSDEKWFGRLGRLLIGVTESLAYLHDRHLVHRDIKPGNVLVRRGGRRLRPCLVDFGLSVPIGDRRRRIGGTPGYIAPECLAGVTGPLTDLYALGATAWRLASGRPPLHIAERATPRDVVATILESSPPPLGEVLPGAPPWFAESADRLLSRDPADRFPSARALWDHLHRHVPGGRRRRAPGGEDTRPSRPPFVGRRSLVTDLVESTAAGLSGEGDGAVPAIVVEGPRGIGKTAVIREVKRRLLLDLAARGRQFPSVIEGTARELASFVTGTGEGDPEIGSWLGGGGPVPVARLARLLVSDRIVGEGVVILIHVQDALELRVVVAVAGLLVSDPRPVVVVAERDTDGSVTGIEGIEGVRVVRLAPLEDPHVAAIARFVMGRTADARRVEHIVSRSAGNPLFAMEMAARLSLPGSHLEDVGARGTVHDLVEASISSLPEETGRVLASLAVSGVELDAGRIAEVLDVSSQDVFGHVRELEERGWVVPGRLGVRAAPLASDVILGSLDDVEVRRLQGRVGEVLEARGHEPAWEASWLRVRGGADGAALDRTIRAGRSLARNGEPARARPLLEEAFFRVRGEVRGGIGLDLARLLGSTGRYDEALQLLDDLDGVSEPDLLLERARCLRLSGRPTDAEVILERIAGVRADGETQVEARALHARILVDRGAPRDALGLLDDISLDGLDADSRVKVLEPLGMVHAALGEAEAADRAFARGVESALDTGRDLEAARFHILRAREHHRRGDFLEALPAYEAAMELARKAGDAHARGVYGMNAGALLTELGRYDEALTHLDSARRELHALGEVREMPWVYFNLANLRVRIGDPDGALELVSRGRKLARRQGLEAFLPYFVMIEGDVARVRGDPEFAAELFAQARRELDAGGDVDGALAARVAAADALSLHGALEEARQVLSDALADDSLQAGSPASDRLAIVAARLARDGDGDREDAATCLERARVGFARRGQTEGLLRATALLLDLSGPRSGNALSGEIRDLLDTMRARTESTGYDALGADPELRSIERMQNMRRKDTDAAPSSMPSGSLEMAGNRWKRLTRINKRIVSETRLRPLLENILDTLLDLTGAMRGFILIRRKDGELKVEAARNIDTSGLPGGERDFSSSIVREVLDGGSPVITVNAAADERFDSLRSVHDLDLKSVLCVPLLFRGTALGAVYVDNPYSSAIFGGEDVELVMDFADQAAIALENARLMSENRKRELRIQRLNRKLERTLERQKLELRGLRETLDRSLPESQEDGRRYGDIVGDSEPMRRLYHLMDRIIESDLPAVIVGESGTGKELVARAIHFHGPRRRGPFVTENCGAIPDTLLESVLFGHIKGAFTGADRDRPGLFEVASGGTLLLDEIASMSQPMQTKLLRTLQEGVVRPLGGSLEKKVDVRILAATNRDLGVLVREGGFREDLYYRINVVTVDVPPLRDRMSDVPALVAHFLEKHAKGRDVRVGKDALGRLMSYDWPGNVRELENEIMRAIVLGGDVIDAGLLLPDREIDGASSQPASDDDLDLKARVERLESALIRRALERTSGNQSAAARLLGISRYGLIKKMNRLGIG